MAALLYIYRWLQVFAPWKHRLDKSLELHVGLKTCSPYEIAFLVPCGCLGSRPGLSSEVWHLVKTRTQMVLKSDCLTFADISPQRAWFSQRFRCRTEV